MIPGTGRSRREWRALRCRMTIEHCEKASWWAWQAEQAADPDERDRCVQMAVAHSAAAQAFRAAS